VRVVRHEGPLAGLLDDWARLHAAEPQATPFMSAGWVRSWWPHYAADADPCLWRAEDGGRVVGIVALVRRRRGPLRVLEPAGLEPGDYWDILAEPGRREEVADAFAAALRAWGGWDAWILRCAVPGTPVVDALERQGLRALVRPPIASPSIELPGSFDAYLAGLSASRRSNLRKHLRRLDGGEVTLDEVTDPERLPAAVDRWHDFRRRQWAAAGREINPEHVSERFRVFVLDVLHALVPGGTGLVWEFSVAGEVVGTYVNFADADAFHWYLGGFDPAVQRLGLGKIAIGHGIRTSIAEGRRRYDFGRGAEPYKYWYGAVDRPLPARVVGTGRARSRLALVAARAILSRQR
jgi:CelD/BcsL family acetyltransferase involved in cellulose biosynthesis